VSTYKTKVIEDLFNARFDPKTGKINNPIVTLDDIVNEIITFNAANPYFRKRPISVKNPANFFKDLIRKITPGNKAWPKSVFAQGFTALPSIGKGGCFEFDHIDPGQLVAFPAITPKKSTLPIPVSTLGVTLLARKLGAHETWLAQVATKLKLIELHLSTASPHNLKYVELLQVGVKNNEGEIDALYMGITSRDKQVLITVEAKVNDDIYFGQIVGQVLAAQNILRKSNEDIEDIIPLAIKSIKQAKNRKKSAINTVTLRPSTDVFVVEFKSVKPSGTVPQKIKQVSESLFELKPHLPNL
jgi:hypothetical protein